LLGLIVLAPAGVAEAQVRVTSDLTAILEAAPGETVEGTIDLFNGADEPHEAKIYMLDYLFHADGRTNTPDPGTLPRSSASWMTLETNFVTVPPKQSYPLRYTIEVPAGADSLSGSYWTIVMVEPVQRGSAESSIGTRAGEDVGVRISQRFRYGVQVVAHIGTTGDRNLEVSSAKLVREEEASSLHIAYSNTGTRAFRPAVWMEIYDSKGAQVDKVEGHSPLMYPASSTTNRLELPAGMAEGKYTALVILDGGEDALFGTQIDFEL
jgi:hypothetical protein